MKVEALIETGKISDAGMQEVIRARADGRWESAYSSAKNSTIPEDFQQALDSNRKANEFFATLNSKNRYAILFRIQSVKKPETRAKRICQFIEMLSNGEKLYP